MGSETASVVVTTSLVVLNDLHLTIRPLQALLRPGRIDRMIYVPLPSNDTRKEIFQVSVFCTCSYCIFDL